MDGINVKSLEEHSEGDVASPSSTGTQVLQCNFSKCTDNIYFCRVLQAGNCLSTVRLFRWACFGLHYYLSAVAMFSPVQRNLIKEEEHTTV